MFSCSRLKCNMCGGSLHGANHDMKVMTHKMTHIYITRRPRFGQVCVFPSNPLGGPQFQRALLCVIACHSTPSSWRWNKLKPCISGNCEIRTAKPSWSKLSIFFWINSLPHCKDWRDGNIWQYMAILEVSWSPRAASNWESKWPVQSFTSKLCFALWFEPLQHASIIFDPFWKLYDVVCLWLFMYV